MIFKGSVAVDGTSLTIFAVDEETLRFQSFHIRLKKRLLAQKDVVISSILNVI